MQSLYQILMLIIDVVWFIMIAHIIMSWLISFQVLNRVNNRSTQTRRKVVKLTDVESTIEQCYNCNYI